MLKNQSITIRTALVSDLHFIVNAQIQMALETEDLKLNPEVLRLGVQAVFNDSQKGQYFIATCNNEPVGMLLTIPEWSDWRNGTVLWIHSVFITKSFRELGIYKKLYLHLKEMVMNSTDLRGLRLYVDKRNLNAQVVYKKLGMDNQHYELYEWLK